jgi:dihydroorotase
VARLFILNGRVVDPASRLDRRMEVIVSGGLIEAVRRPGGDRPKKSDRVLDAAGLLVLPGLIDMHVHLRDPGMTAAEDVATGTRAAAAGGFATVVCMPNTKPVLDNRQVLEKLVRKIMKNARVRVLPAPSLSLGLRGRRLSNIEARCRAGAGALSDDGIGTADRKILGGALRRGMDCGLSVLVHCQDHGLSGRAAEDRATRAALRALAESGGRLHVQHVSTAGSLAAVRSAKKRGLPVSCEVTPHHLFLTEGDVRASGGDPNLKMNPPLRNQSDRRALLKGLADGTVDAVASDHAPHTRSAKDLGFAEAPYGVTGLETTLALVLRLVREKVISLERAVALLTCGPAGALGIAAGTLQPGAKADITVVDPARKWRVVPSKMKSRSRNTAFSGWEMLGKTEWTIVGGRVVYSARRRA